MSKEMSIEWKLIILAIILLIITIIASFFVSGAYNANNAFTEGDEIDVFTGNCTYQNSSNLSEYIDCDSSVECRMTAFFPNGTLIEAYKECSRIGNTFNYSFGYWNATGTYNARILCYGKKGWITKDFTFTISATSTASAGTGGGGFGKPRPDEPEPEPEPEITITDEDKLDEIIDKFKNFFVFLGETISEKNPMFGLAILFIVLMIIIMFIKRYKERALKKIEKREAITRNPLGYG